MATDQLHLVTHVLCPYVQRSVIVLKEKGVAYKRTDIDLSNTPDWFNRISPMGKVPVLVVNDNDVLFESAVICEYINEITPASLHPKDPFAKARHRAWIEFGSGILDSIGGLYSANEQSTFDNKKTEVQEKFQLIEAEINGSQYFSGDQFQIIDAVYGPIFRYFDVFDTILDHAVFDTTPKVKIWRQALQQRDSVQQAVSPHYPELLMQFLKERNSHISRLIL